MTEPLFDTIAIVGLGLIGSSVARGVKVRGLARKVVGYDLSPQVHARAKELAFSQMGRDRSHGIGRRANRDCDEHELGTSHRVRRRVGDPIAEGAIVTEVGSVKAAVIRQVLAVLTAQATFVPGHPIAGTEHSGPDAGFAELFEGRWCILTPCERSSDAAVEKVTALWRGLGSAVEVMTPEHHDIVLAITSHIPHLIAFNIVGTAADVEEVTRSEVIKFSAGCFRDFTRIAASDPVMWRDVFLNNKEAVLEMLGRFSEDLAALQRMIRWDDGTALLELFTRTRAIRRGIIEAGQETDEPDFGRRHGQGPEHGH